MQNQLLTWGYFLLHSLKVMYRRNVRIKLDLSSKQYPEKSVTALYFHFKCRVTRSSFTIWFYIIVARALIEKLRWWGSSSCVAPRTLRWDLQWAMDTGNASVSTGPGAGRLSKRKRGIAMSACTVQIWGCVEDLKPAWCLTESCWTE